MSEQPYQSKIIRRAIKFENTDDKLKRAQEMARKNVSAMEIISKLTQSSHEDWLDKWITNDDSMLVIKRKIRSLLHRQEPVLITGPTGTGKEILARALKKTGEPFLAVNCGGLAKELVPSIFFGHVKGSFTGAHEDRKGVLEQAENGVVFLDEIAELPNETQATLLRALQEGEIYRVGSVIPIKISCRFVAATRFHLRDVMEGLVKGKFFREDLFARLYTFELVISGLKERPNDIPLIAAAYNWDQEIPDIVLPDIYRYNVRAIQTYIARMTTYGTYI